MPASRRTIGRRVRRCLATVTAATVVALLAALGAVALPAGAAVATTADAGGSSSGDAVGFDVTGYRCSSEVVGETVRPGGTTVVRTVDRGLTRGSIALLDGELTVRSTLVVGPDGQGRVNGRWTLQPEGSTGRLQGVVRGSFQAPDVTELTISGRGTGALRGVRVTMTTRTPHDGSVDGCASDLNFTGTGSATAPATQAPRGAVVVQGAKPFADAVADLTAAIEANPNLTLVRTVDHRAAAASRGLVLPPTTELFFGNPRIGTPLMQSAQTTGIDLPQKMLVWQDLLGRVHVAYNAPAYLQSRHGITGADAQLQTVANALAGLASVASGTTVEPVFDAGRVGRREGLVRIRTERDAAEAFADIVAALEAAPPVNVALVLEHDANAARVGLDLDPTKLVVFGNPSLGTGLMQTDQSIALDLPQKILVYTDDDGRTTIAYNSPRYVARRHGVKGQGDLLDVLDEALRNFASAGT